METLAQLLSRDAAWHPPRGELADWIAEATRPGGPPALLQEARWWQAREAARQGDWARVTTLAGEGLGEPWSERESLRLALLHALSGNVAEAQHVLAQAIQWRSGEELLGRFAALCEAEGLLDAAAQFRRLGGRAR